VSADPIHWPTGQVKASWGSQTYPTVKLYDAQGRLTGLRTFRSQNLSLAPDDTTGNHDDTTWIYTADGRLAAKRDAAGKGNDYTYTAGGLLATRTSARGITTTYTYNVGQLTGISYSDGTPAVTLTSNNLGQRLSVSNGIAKSDYAYDPATLALKTETVSYDLDGQPGFEFTRVIDLSRDTLGRDSGWQLQNGTTLENQAAYAYGSDGRLSQVSNPQISNTPFTYSYLANSNLPASVTGPVHTVTNTWAADRDALLSKENKTGTTTVSSYTYTVNALGQRTNLATVGTAFASSHTTAWGYDALGQVTSAATSDSSADRAYQYDAIGNRISRSVGVSPTSSTATYAANALNQYTGITTDSVTATPAYDDDGNATSYPLPINPSANSILTWDAENRLTEVKTSSNTSIAKYSYDSFGRRIEKTSTINNQLSTISYLYDGWNIIADYAIQHPTSNIPISGALTSAERSKARAVSAVSWLFISKIRNPRSSILLTTETET
jgi:YD repeat-containing protein